MQESRSERPDPTRVHLSAVLMAKGAGGVRHSGRTLLDHLLGTYDLLHAWKCEESICVAGGLHAIYSTEFFKYTLVDTIDRPEFQQTFGEFRERLAWLFCTLNRRKVLESELFVNRATDEPLD